MGKYHRLLAGVGILFLAGEEERKSYDRISVGTDSIGGEGALAALGEILEGDVIGVGYDGMIMESYPAQITGIFAIEIIGE